MVRRDYRGILFIGDPHLASRVPGFRKDDYPQVVLAKLAWCLDYARREDLLPAILGDVFHNPRDNANSLLGELLAVLGGRETLAVCGNHDCQQNELADEDTLSVVIKAGMLRMVDREGPWRGAVAGKSVVIGGTAWSERLPDTFDRAFGGDRAADWVFWIAHHDLIVPGYEEQGRFRPREIPGIDVVVNGHIHRRRLEDATTGKTLWITPGNISRVSRSDASRSHAPAAMRVDITETGWDRRSIEVPHQPSDAVFHSEVVVDAADSSESSFVQGLAELQARRTQDGAGLDQFLEANLIQFEEPVATEIRRLAKEVIKRGNE